MNSRLIAIIVWCAAELVLQIHGIQFWSEHGGWHGWLWSIVLCVATVWFWLHPVKPIRIVFGVLASTLLIAGPLWQVGSPLATEIENRYAQQQSVTVQSEVLRNSETELSATLETYLRNSEERTGWAPIIAQVRDKLDVTRDRIALLSVTAPAQRMAFLSVAVIVIQLATLLVLQVATVAALQVFRNALTVAKKPHGSPVPVIRQPPKQQASPQASEPPDPSRVKTMILQGRFGETPSMRKVMDKTKLRHDRVKPIFKALLDEGKLIRDGQKFVLCEVLSDA